MPTWVLLAAVPAFDRGISWAAIVCLVLGILFIGIEMLTPGFSAPGILGILLVIVSIVLGARTLMEALVMILAVLIVLSIMLIVVMTLANRGKLDRSPLILSNQSSREAGYLSTQDMDYFVGCEGKALTILRPSGTVELNGVRLDAITNGEFLEAGTPIQVEKVEGRRMVVRALPPKQ